MGAKSAGREEVGDADASSRSLIVPIAQSAPWQMAWVRNRVGNSQRVDCSLQSAVVIGKDREECRAKRPFLAAQPDGGSKESWRRRPALCTE